MTGARTAPHRPDRQRDAGYPRSARARGYLLSGHRCALATMPAWNRSYASAASEMTTSRAAGGSAQARRHRPPSRWCAPATAHTPPALQRIRHRARRLPPAHLAPSSRPRTLSLDLAQCSSVPGTSSTGSGVLAETSRSVRHDRHWTYLGPTDW